jgi:DNA-binding Lrp family transcriptional regulator
MDELDRRIIKILKEDARVPMTKVSKKLDVPETTLYFRINKMLKDGVIEKFTVVLREDNEDLKVAYIKPKDYLISEMSKRVFDRVATEISKHPDVRFVAKCGDHVTVIWHGDEFDPHGIPGVSKVEIVNSVKVYKIS